MNARENGRLDEAWDLIVVGAGAGGMTAALTAAHKGLKVVLCEATSQVGGTTATSAGTLWLPGNRHGQQAGLEDSARAGEQYLEAISGPDDALARRRAFLDSANAAIEFLERHTSLAFVTAGYHPDYLIAPGAATHGRALSPQPFDGRLLGKDFWLVRPPLDDFLLLGGMMAGKADLQALVHRYRSWKDFRHTLALVGRYACDRLRYPRGTRLVLGNALVARFLYSLRAAGVELRFDTRLVGLDKDGNGRVCGAIFESESRRVSLRAKAGVVLATGGIGHNAKLRAALDPDAFESLAPQSVRGDGITLARDVGAQFEHQGADFLWQPVSRVPTPDGGHRLFPHLYLDRAKPGLIAVDQSGQRFVNEGTSYHHFVAALMERGGGLPAWLICDAAFVTRYGLGIVPPGTRRFERYQRSGYLVAARTPQELAQRLGIDAHALADSIRRNNASAANGHDADFGKGSTPVCRFNGDASHSPNPCLGPIATPPFLALAIWPADAASCSGLRTDADGRVLGTGDRAIGGLYACGNDMSSVMNGSYPGPGATLGPAIVFGWRVALHAESAIQSMNPLRR